MESEPYTEAKIENIPPKSPPKHQEMDIEEATEDSDGMLCTDDMCRLGVYILGEGKKFYVLTKYVKKIHFCLVWGFSND